MKLKISNTQKSIALLLLITCLTACYKVDKSSIEEVSTGTLLFHIHTNIGDSEVEEYGVNYMDENGRSMSLSMAQMYISEVELIKLDGSIYHVDNKYVLKVFETEELMIGEVPVGNYKSIRFKVGLPPVVNAFDPLSAYDTLILNQSTMWYSTPVQPNGYVFINIAGTIDTTETMNGNQIPFSYKIGTNSNTIQIEMPEKYYTVLEGKETYIHMMNNYSKLFSGIQLSTESNLSINSISDNSLPIVEVLKNNIRTFFVFN